jgi:glutamyl-Q tRNA(Asp) synthetase
MTSSVYRFAPSPNGHLHLGHALSALTAFDMAQRTGGQFLLRIEDIDVARCREEYVAGILEDLSWLGISWQEPILRQSQHFATYVEAAQWLEAQGLLYPCFASRSEIDAAAQPGALDPDGAPVYPGLHKGMAPTEIETRMQNGERFALRLDMEKALKKARERLSGAPLTFTELEQDGSTAVVEAQPQRWGDAVILRKDVPASYHLAVVVDDARQGVTHVTRGRDLYAATDIHRLLQVLMGLPQPAYHHHRLLSDSDGKKLSKSAGDTALADIRAAGASPGDIRRMVGLA